MVDTARKAAAAHQPELPEDAEVPAGNDRYPAVRVMVESPEIPRARTIVVSTANSPGWAQVLGLEPCRRMATIVALDQPVVLVTSPAARDDPRNATAAAGQPASGFTLPINVPFPVTAKGQVFVVATSATPGRVSVWEELYEPQ